ncbi:hypothetical protein GQF42_42070 [Streptomyces broussonetiae]|uniref:DUF5666 domain-containing protein n=1 Tax=Streptomyces broussonetiae TaxID=2686304 RepID=A0A6I6NC12_9ACTN|nr:hypothetical protein [Streptomyces broussonetiae]QHA08954.1 hypothetical protein GQF42_42070 [Streptomyces broussonetiae]
MKLARSTMVTATAGAAAALAVTGITYASASSAPVPQAAPAAVAQAPQTAPAPAAAPLGGDSGQGTESKGTESKGNEGKGNEGGGGGRREEGRRHEEGRILVNERSYSAHAGDCITVISGLGAKTLNVRNETHERVEVFRGVVCDNGAPIATVGPHSSSFGVDDLHVKDGVHVKNGIVASFRVVCRHED